jgi:hypothetical protein
MLRNKLLSTKQLFSRYGTAPYLKETQIKAEIYDSQMKLEVSQRRLEESRLDSTRRINQDDIDNSQKKVLQSERKLMEAQSKLENYKSSRNMIDNRTQDEVNGVNGETPTLDIEEMVETAKDDREFQEFMAVVSTPQKPE